MSASYLRKYATGSGADIYINIPKAGSANHAVSADWTPAGGDVKVSIDGGAAANIGTLPTAVAMGNSAIWKFVFSNAELTGAFISVTVSDSATKAVDDTGFSIETYGNASALHAFDLDTATQNVNVSTITAGAVTAAAIADGAIDAATFAAGAINAAAIADSAIDAATFAAGAINAAAIAADAITAAKIADGAIDAATFAAGAIDAAAIAADAIGASELAAGAATEIANAVLTVALTEGYAADGAAPTLTQAVFAIQQFLQERAVSGTTLTVKKLDGSTSAMVFTLNDGTSPTSITRSS